MNVIKMPFYRYTIIAPNFKRFDLAKIKQLNIFTDDELNTIKRSCAGSVLTLDSVASYDLTSAQWEAVLKEGYCQAHFAT